MIVRWKQLIPFVLFPSVCVGIALTLAPVPTAGAVAGLTLLLLIAYPLRRHCATMFLSVVLLVPADHMTVIFGPPRGLFAIGFAACIALVLVFQGQAPYLRWRDYDIYLIVCSVALSVLGSSDPTQSRILIFWGGGLLTLSILNGSRTSDVSVRRQIMDAVLISGAASGAVAWVEYLSHIPSALQVFYEPHTVSGEFFRASGLSGHPLRLGTLTMLASLFGCYALVNLSLSPKGRVLTASATCLSLTGLILTGARGAWLGVVVGAMASVASTMGRSRRIVFRILCTSCVVVGLLVVTGLGDLVLERTMGGAVAPQSIEQRIEAARVVSRAWMMSPILGVGPAGVEGTLYSGGLLLPNIENDYLVTLLSMGMVGTIALIFLVGRRLSIAWRITDFHGRALAIASLAALFTNMGTYNFLTWSCGATMIAALASLVWPDNEMRRFGDATAKSPDGSYVPRKEGR